MRAAVVPRQDPTRLGGGEGGSGGSGGLFALFLASVSIISIIVIVIIVVVVVSIIMQEGGSGSEMDGHPPPPIISQRDPAKGVPALHPRGEEARAIRVGALAVQEEGGGGRGAAAW